MSTPEPPPRRLPDVTLTAPDGGAVPLRVARHASVLVLLPPVADAAARAFLRDLAAATPALAGWDGRVLVVGSTADDVGGERGDGFPRLADPRGLVATAAGVTAPALVVADQWGDVHWAAPVVAGGAWPAVAAIEPWVRYLAIRCAG